MTSTQATWNILIVNQNLGQTRAAGGRVFAIKKEVFLSVVNLFFKSLSNLFFAMNINIDTDIYDLLSHQYTTNIRFTISTIAILGFMTSGLINLW